MKNIDRLPFPELVDEMVKFANKQAVKAKASKIYYMCLRAGKKELAGKIAAKYYLHLR